MYADVLTYFMIQLVTCSSWKIFLCRLPLTRLLVHPHHNEPSIFRLRKYLRSFIIHFLNLLLWWTAMNETIT